MTIASQTNKTKAILRINNFDIIKAIFRSTTWTTYVAIYRLKHPDNFFFFHFSLPEYYSSTIEGKVNPARLHVIF